MERVPFDESAVLMNDEVDLRGWLEHFADGYPKFRVWVKAAIETDDLKTMQRTLSHIYRELGLAPQPDGPKQPLRIPCIDRKGAEDRALEKTSIALSGLQEDTCVRESQRLGQTVAVVRRAIWQKVYWQYLEEELNGTSFE